MSHLSHNSARSVSSEYRSRRHFRDYSLIISTVAQKPSYDYEGTILCGCGRRSPIWYSWSDRNPGRRFNGCASSRRCGFLQWIDDEHDIRAQRLFIGLRNRERQLVDRNKELESVIVNLKEELNDLRNLTNRHNSRGRSQLCEGLSAPVMALSIVVLLIIIANLK
ncbi:hypothetical protein Tsubulata_032308 [Turnera subulata]|uniref:GRF-type domain-containing protein n=1 Tax=Turnera subulata TaxID=218843 RepID=A0A9Q0FSU0_9ROSI|nr:hypothetical protein Tsubulata_032308 [Turnera subulata]